jgi:signal transduction histidine kinase
MVLPIPRALATLILLLLLPASASAEQAKRVLFLHSYGPHFSPFNTFAREMREDLVRASPRTLDIYEASIETARFVDAGGESGPLLEYLLALFAGRPPDLVVAVGAPAARFAQSSRARFYPSSPLLLAALEARTVQPAALTPGDAVASVELDVPGTVEGILELLPETERVLVILGTSPLEQGWRALVQNDLAPLEGRVAFEWLEPVGFDAVLRRVAALPPRSAVLYGLMFVDGDGTPHEEQQALAEIAAASAAPVFGFFESQLGHGVVGGRLVPVSALAREAADIALQLLEGAAPADLRPTPLPPTTPVFDARQLARWNIGAARLPEGSRIAFRQPTAWDQYRWQILVIAAALVVEGGFIVALLVSRERLRRSRRALRRSEQEARELSGRLISAQEDERARLARELHDDTTQRLAMLAIGAGRGERAAVGEDSVLWREMREELARLSEDVHALSYRLHPSTLADLGLAEALRSECDRFARAEEIVVAKEIDGVPGDVPAATALAVFRVAQEALRNVARHARASHVAVALRRPGGALVLRVRDDGVGFDVEGRSGRGLGLASMRQRVALLGGAIEVRSAPGQGTDVRISVPIGEDDDEPAARPAR